MIYAIPTKDDSVANHFIKAPQFSFVTDAHSLIQSINNPAAGNSSCKDKSAAITMLKEMKADAVLVRNIGERALGKLLSAGIRVFMVTGKTSISNATNMPKLELTDASQGRPSINHHKKEGGCSHSGSGGCCGSSHDDTHSGCGCSRQKHARDHSLSGKKRAMRKSLSGISFAKPIK